MPKRWISPALCASLLVWHHADFEIENAPSVCDLECSLKIQTGFRSQAPLNLSQTISCQTERRWPKSSAKKKR
jgi:hypothetical protein